MAEHMKTSQAELNELLTEYWKLRHETGMPSMFATISTDGSTRGLYGNSRKQAWDASSKYMTLYLCRLYVSRAVRSNRVFLVWISNRGGVLLYRSRVCRCPCYGRLVLHLGLSA